MFAKKNLGQHFLISPQAIKKTVESANLTRKDIVLEIGPGTGSLTKELILKAKKVIAVEKDLELVQSLNQTFKKEIKNKKLEIIHDDILKCDLKSFGLKDGKYKVVANIPYYITSILMRTLLSNKIQPNTLVLIVQKEIAERIARDSKESILSLSVKAYGSPKYIGTIKSGAFRPSPKVDSAILLVEDISRDFFYKIKEEVFFKLVKTGFSSKRKFLLNNISAIADKNSIAKEFKKIGIKENVRAEDLPLNIWREIVDFI
jgi:16S rRNA (adenine1518-N6/adenine1519-N6)-dimethyltransferase